LGKKPQITKPLYLNRTLKIEFLDLTLLSFLWHSRNICATSKTSKFFTFYPKTILSMDNNDFVQQQQQLAQSVMDGI
jgi:hypothetical protein